MASHSSQSRVFRKESSGEGVCAGASFCVMPSILAGNQGCIRVYHGEGTSVVGKRSRLTFRGLQGEQPWCPPRLKGPLGLEFKTRKVGRAWGWVRRPTEPAKNLRVWGGGGGGGSATQHLAAISVFLSHQGLPGDWNPCSRSGTAGPLLTHLWGWGARDLLDGPGKF